MTNDHATEIVIETPKGSKIKYTWDEKRNVLKFKKCMPLGFVFPFDFGMVPGTKAEDGDPVDVLLLVEDSVYPGSFIDVRIIAALTATQRKNDKYRNDRLIAIESTCPVFGHFKSLGDLTEHVKDQIGNFFKSYNEVQGKEFTPLEWVDADEAMGLIKEATIKK